MSEGDFAQQWLVGNAVPAILLLGLTIPLIVLVSRAHGAALRAFDPRSSEAQLLRRTRTRWTWLAALLSAVALVVVLLVAAGIGVALALTDPATDPGRMNVVVYLFVAAIAGASSVFFTPAAVLAAVAVPVVAAIVFGHLGLRAALRWVDRPDTAAPVAAARAQIAGTGVRAGVLVLGIVGLLCAVAAGWVMGYLSVGLAASLLTPPAAGSKTM